MTALVITEITLSSSPSTGQYQDTCPPLPIVEHGTPSTYNTEIGTQVTYRCDQGYVLVGYKTISCYKRGRWGMWNGRPPYCMRKYTNTNSAADLIYIRSEKIGYHFPSQE